MSVMENSDITQDLIPIEVEGYRVLIKQEHVAYLFKNKDTVLAQIKKHIGFQSSTDPVYIDLELEISENPVTENSKALEKDLETETENVYNKLLVRHEWKYSESLHLINLVKTHYNTLQTSQKKQGVWLKIAKSLHERIKGKLPKSVSAEQVKERWNTLKKSYKKHVQKCKKTGNGAPRNYMYEKEMYDILQNDPNFDASFVKGYSPNIVSEKSENDEKPNKSSDEDNADTSAAAVSNVQAIPENEAGQKQNTVGELKELFAERDADFLKRIETLFQTTNNLLQQLIDKIN